MKIVNRVMTILTLISILMLASTNAFAVENYETVGTIEKLETGSVTANQQKYWLTPTTKIVIRSIDNAKFSDLKLGDYILIKARTIGDRHYADVILFFPTKDR